MKPSIFNYALAHAAGFSAAIGIVWALGVLFGNLQFPEVLADSGVALWTVIAAIPTAALGWILGMLLIGPPVYWIASRLQGAPFHDGDHVWVLVGQHKGTLTHVYEVWMERGQVRVDLGPDAKEKVTDVFGWVEVCRDRGPA